MNRLRLLLTTLATAVAWLGCSDEPSGPGGPGPDDADLILSNPVTATVPPSFGAGVLGTVTLVSLPPGSVPGADSVVIRNVSGEDEVEVSALMVNGGFDPVPVKAEAGDRLELEFRADGTVLARKYGTVPARRPPVIVRVSPPPGRTDVALGVRPTAVFSEPVDPATLDAAMALVAQDPTEGQVAPLSISPWVVEFIPTELLEPSTEYEFSVSQSLRDLDGDALEADFHSGFTTASTAPPPPPPPAGTELIAFTSTRDGGFFIYVANPDGSGQRRLVSGSDPAWSPDGEKIAFSRSGLWVIDADGANETLIADWCQEPDWSPDGTKLVCTSADGIEVVGTNGEGREMILPRSQVGQGYWVGFPTWSPDGTSIAFQVGPPAELEVIWVVWVMDATGTNPRPLHDDEFGGWFKMEPSWSPDGARIAFWSADDAGPEPGVMHRVIASMARDGTGGRTIHYRDLNSSSIVGPDWSPGGREFAFSQFTVTPGGVGTRIFVFDMETGGTRRLIPDVSGPGIAEDYDDSQVAWSRAGP